MIIQAVVLSLFVETFGLRSPVVQGPPLSLLLDRFR